MNKATSIEVEAFYYWLKGGFKSQRENLLPVYVALPSMRDELLREYLKTYDALHRLHAMRLALSRGA